MRTSLSAAFSAVLLVLLTVLVPVSALSAWVDLELDDADRYLAAVSPLASDPDVRNTVASVITDEALKNIDVGPLQETVAQFLRETAQSFTTTEAFQRAWDTANRTAHEAVTAALHGESGQAVTIELAPVIEEVKRELISDGVPFAGLIPVRDTSITVLSADRADELRTSFQWLRYCSVWPAVGTVVLLLLVPGLALVRGGARAALGAAAVVGGGFVLGSIVLRVLVATGRSRVLDQVPGSDRDGAAAVYDALTASLRTTAWIVLLAGAVLVIGGVAGRILTARRTMGR
ncbi:MULTISPECIES: hypothetical protein [Streptomyces]|uniref:Integral membrane protein n=1 Tax=Streptomyces clavifer TaxID=68188 RepID=A0ABS4V9E1_9ACTN|nr:MULTISPECIES: hypothetical protein [Streptomyces]KQX77766.1 hypothetical protein ASD26_16245 [Streptomyces sp. Root1319]KQZ10331.1 hypothetical protein ASD51_08750 [Streptomyces sp. Root55]MBP2360416.1 hypothetical protein [Streptomyces clavifer]MDX2743572.1 hypothetical protein [Streptomyces sp. NRRL_B-2557]WRY82974.1 hypothetical protein OG388_17940 [Streptomyces clavifer]